MPERESRMSKPEKKNARKENKIKSKKAAGETGAMGKLVALEGTKGPAVREEAERLARLCRGCGEPAWSRWDASGTFFELRLGKAKTLTPTPRTLLLLYASDLLFRLRWEITPAMKEGRTVVAAPYVELAIGRRLPTGPTRKLQRKAGRPVPLSCGLFFGRGQVADDHILLHLVDHDFVGLPGLAGVELNRLVDVLVLLFGQLVVRHHFHG